MRAVNANDFIREINDLINKLYPKLQVSIELEVFSLFRVFPYVDIDTKKIYIPPNSISYILLINEVLCLKEYKGDVVKDLYFLQQSLNLRNAGMVEVYGKKYLNDLSFFIDNYRNRFSINNTALGDFEYVYQFFYSIFHEVCHIVVKDDPSLMNWAGISASIGSKITTIIPFWEAKKLVKDTSYLEEIYCDSVAFECLKTLFNRRFPNENEDVLLKLVCRAIWMVQLDTNNYNFLGSYSRKGYESVLTSISLRIVLLNALQKGSWKGTRLRRIPRSFEITPEINQCFIDNLTNGFVVDFNEDELKTAIETVIEREYDLFSKI